MTKQECAIIMAYTGKCMLTGTDFNIFHKYVEDIMGRPVFTHEMGIGAIADEIKEKSKADFLDLCANAQTERTGHWIMSTDKYYRPICDKCGSHPWKGYIPTVEEATKVFKYCPKCGARMVGDSDETVNNSNHSF